MSTTRTFPIRVPFAALPFFFFVLWLLAVPMEGPLLTSSGAAGSSRWFLVTHVATLVVIARCIGLPRLRHFACPGAVATALLTLLIPFADDHAPLLMVALGITAAPMAVKACSDLQTCRQPIQAAAWCLVCVNLALAMIQASTTLWLWPKLLPFLPLLTIPAIIERPTGDTPLMPLCRSYLVFVFIFQIVSGLMYGYLYPAYAAHAFFQGLELPFYMAAVLVAMVVYQKNADLLLVGGMTLAMMAFGLLQLGGGIAINLAMFAMQAATGCIDMFLLAFLLVSTRSTATFAYGLAVLCGGIAFGQFLSLALGAASGPVGLAGSLVLNIAALALFLRHNRRQDMLLAPTANPALTGQPALATEVAFLLSTQEINVLTRVLEGKNYREVAEALAISESSVKTYMKRAYDKLDVSTRQELIRRLGISRANNISV